MPHARRLLATARSRLKATRRGEGPARRGACAVESARLSGSRAAVGIGSAARLEELGLSAPRGPTKALLLHSEAKGRTTGAPHGRAAPLANGRGASSCSPYHDGEADALVLQDLPALVWPTRSASNSCSQIVELEQMIATATTLNNRVRRCTATVGGLRVRSLRSCTATQRGVGGDVRGQGHSRYSRRPRWSAVRGARFVAAWSILTSCRSHDFWQETRHTYLVMRWLETLEDRLRRGPASPLDETMPIIDQFSGALNALVISSRDVSRNLLLDDDGNASCPTSDRLAATAGDVDGCEFGKIASLRGPGQMTIRWHPVRHLLPRCVDLRAADDICCPDATVTSLIERGTRPIPAHAPRPSATTCEA